MAKSGGSRNGSVGGGRYGFVILRGSKSRKCGKCEAGPGHSCGKWTTMQTWQILKRPHPGR